MDAFKELHGIPDGTKRTRMTPCPPAGIDVGADTTAKGNATEGAMFTGDVVGLLQMMERTRSSPMMTSPKSTAWGEHTRPRSQVRRWP